MPIVTPPPVVTPPAVVVTQPQTQEQNQQQQQDQNNTTNLGTLNQDQNTKSDADSTADSTSTQSSTLSNIQVNNNSNRVEFGTFKIPETTLNINSFVNGGEGRSTEYGAVIGVNIPLGGKTRGRINKALDIQIATDQLAFERSYASVCSNIDTDSYDVSNRASTLTMLKSCRTEIVKRPSVIPVPPVTPPVVTPPPVVQNNDLEQLRKENAELRLLIAQLAEKLDNNNKLVPGGA